MKRGRPTGSVDLRGAAHRVKNDNVDVTLKTIAQIVRQARVERGIAVAELAAATGICEQALFTLERSRNGPPRNVSIRTLIRLAHALGVQPSELMP